MEISIQQLESLLAEQRLATGEYITRNLSIYSWWKELNSQFDLDTAKQELKNEAYASPPPEEFKILKKYIK